MMMRRVCVVFCISILSLNAFEQERIEHFVETHMPVVAQAVTAYKGIAEKYVQNAQRLDLSVTQSIAEQTQELQQELNRLFVLQKAVQKFQNHIKAVQQLSTSNVGIQLLNDIVAHITSKTNRWTPPASNDSQIIRSLKGVFSGASALKARNRFEEVFRKTIANDFSQTNARLNRLITIAQGQEICSR